MQTAIKRTSEDRLVQILSSNGTSPTLVTDVPFVIGAGSFDWRGFFKWMVGTPVTGVGTNLVAHAIIVRHLTTGLWGCEGGVSRWGHYVGGELSRFW